MSFKDHFSGHAVDYARFRPLYPPSLFAWLASQAPARRLAVDCGTGNGQAANALAAHFERVVATDASAPQVAQAQGPDNVSYRVAPAEAEVVAAGTADLVTVAQALHWFDVEAFYSTAARALAPGGLLAVWTYELMTVSAAVDAAVLSFYRGAIDGYWPPERDHVENGYRDIVPAWPRVAAPRFEVRANWRADDALDYLASWSAVRRCRRATGQDPVGAFANTLRTAWGPQRRSVRWPLVLHSFRRPSTP
ncbi:MAG: class I SAM-dependent methyltransferase [Pseudomonadota bacterium]